jgi:purine-nucleoside phosphorylase
MLTPHNAAKKNEVAKIVLMPGDPLRAKWIAQKFLKNPKLINEIRGMYAFTGTYKGKRITVMGHGMGIPSVGIYTYELFKFYDVDAIIRVGSAGAYSKDVELGDVLIAKDASSNSFYAEDIGVKVKNGILAADKKLLDLAIKTAKDLEIKTNVCRVNSTDVFYNKYTLAQNIKRSQGAKAVEMEAFAIYANAIKTKKKALTLLTCSDSLVTGKQLSPEDRQTNFNDMIKVALETAYKF